MSTHTPGPAEKKLITAFERMIDDACERMSPREFIKTAKEASRIMDRAIAKADKKRGAA
jgi:hypothetical protein